MSWLVYSLRSRLFFCETPARQLCWVDIFLPQEAINWMGSNRDVFHDGIGVVGVSKGADIALLMAAHSPKV